VLLYHRNLEPLDLLIIQHDKYVEIGFGMMNALAKCQMPRVLIKNNWSYKLAMVMALQFIISYFFDKNICHLNFH
jgi:hypothetical protein